MRKIILYSIVVLIVLIVVGICLAYFWWPNQQQGQPKNEPIGNSVTGNEETSVTQMPETNPFKTEVNPMDGYVNPFSK